MVGYGPWLADETTREVDIANQEVDELIPPLCHAPALAFHQGQLHGGDRRWPAPDVGGPVFHPYEVRPAHHQRRAGDHGVRTAGCHWVRRWAIQGTWSGLLLAMVGSSRRCKELGTIVQGQDTGQDRHRQQRLPGMVRQWQQFFYEKRYAGTPMLSPDYMKLADAYGIPSLRVTSNDGVADAFRTANEHDGPFLVEFRVKEEVNVYPMVAPGRTSAR